jgi:hypothetical protein
MAEDFVIETTNESGAVNQERVSLSQIMLVLRDRSLVRIDGLERATVTKKLISLQVHDACPLSCDGSVSHMNMIVLFALSCPATASSMCQRVCSR